MTVCCHGWLAGWFLAVLASIETQFIHAVNLFRVLLTRSLTYWLALSLVLSLPSLSPFSVSVCLCFCLYLSVSLILTNTYTNTDTHLLFPLLLFINSLTHSLTSLTTSLQPAKHPEKYVSPSPPQTGVKNFRLVAHAQ